jgi:hypothetical protein
MLNIQKFRRGPSIRQLLYLCLCACAGCPPSGIKAHKTPPPPRPTAEVVETIQQNAALLQSGLFGKHISVNAKVRDAKRRSQSYNLEGTLLYRRPRDLRVDLRPGLGNQVMGIGSNADEYWIWIDAEGGSMRWGKHIYAGKPCADSDAVMPHQLATSLGLGLPIADEGLDGPVRRGGDEYDILEYIRRTGPHSIIDREYWIDRFPPFMVRKIIFRDELGQDAMIAVLDEYRADYPQAPLAPHKIEVRWPSSDSRLRIEISSFKSVTSDQISPASFVRPTREKLPDGVKDIIQVDKSCETTTLAPSSD